MRYQATVVVSGSSVAAVFTRPSEISDSAILAFVADYWPVEADAAEYAPVGFGSHHWYLGNGRSWDWFVTVHDLAAKARSQKESLGETFHRLWAAFQTARDLADLGIDFALAPDRSSAGEIVHRLDERFTVSCFPCVTGLAGDYGKFHSEIVRIAVAGHLVDLHDIDIGAVKHCRVEDFEIPSRNECAVALGEVDDAWNGGPYAEPARQLLRTNAENVASWFKRYDDGVHAALAAKDEWVATHGEPHGSNVITTGPRSLLIDWDTTLIAPRERDVWHLDADGATAARIYSQAGGRPPDAEMIELYRLQWDLMEIAGYIALFRAAHEDTEDAQESFRNLSYYIAPRR